MNNDTHQFWNELKSLTPARIGMGRTGVSIKTSHLLEFRCAHARTRDAVYSALDVINIKQDLLKLNVSVYEIESAAQTRIVYLQRPDLGRILSERSRKLLQKVKWMEDPLVIIVADGLSATAIQRHAAQFIKIFLGKAQQISTNLLTFISLQSRVAIGDEIGGLTGAKISVVLIGERPGLSAPDSMGIYMTYGPKPGLTDESRNCISNIHSQGLTYEEAADKLIYLLRESFSRKLSGVCLKESDHLLL